jgi:hypothetical protein
VSVLLENALKNVFISAYVIISNERKKPSKGKYGAPSYSFAWAFIIL